MTVEQRGLVYDGFPSFEEIREANGRPSAERLAKGPVAVCECVQQIPCNPCEGSCMKGCIHVGKPITNTPRIDFDRCVGCGLCAAACSGLAIFIINMAYSETEATVTFPFEYLPLPEVGSRVQALSRAGEYVCMGEVVRIQDIPKNDHTVLVTVAVPGEFADDVRTMKRAGAPLLPASPRAAEGKESLPDDVLVCRCEEVTAGEIRRAVRRYGAGTVTEVKRRVRAGMGLCQGRSCSKLTMKILAEETGKRPDELEPTTSRPPIRPATFGELAKGGHMDE